MSRKPASRIKVAPTKQAGIQAFGKISKAQVQNSSKGNQKRKHEATISFGEDSPSLDGKHIKKPRTVTNSEQVVTIPVEKKTIQPQKSCDAKESPSSQLPSTPTNARKIAPLKSRIKETPTKGARALLECFALATSASSPPVTSSSPRSEQETPPSSPPPATTDAEDIDAEKVSRRPLPVELQDLICLYSSFLTALSLYYAHNGLSNPADLRNLYPGIERTWKKRRVTPEDIRRILGLGYDPKEGKEKGIKEALFSLSDYGHGKICVEVSDHLLERPSHQLLDERALNDRFSAALRQQWSAFQRKHRNTGTQAFISQLPLAEITPCASLIHLNPLLSKGQHRRADLKAGAIAAQTRNNSSSTALKQSTSLSSSSIVENKPQPVKSRATSLLDRLYAKSVLQSTFSAAPSPQQIARKRCLQRVTEIAPVLASLAVGSQKHNDNDTSDGVEERKLVSKSVSFTMATLVQHLQMSLRNPIAKDEAVGCVRILAELAPEWVGIREVGRCVGITVRGQGIVKSELELRVKRADGNL